jgi:hypothetical protein
MRDLARPLCRGTAACSTPDWPSKAPAMISAEALCSARFWTRSGESCHARTIKDQSPDPEKALCAGEAAVALPVQPDAGVFFIGMIRALRHSRRDCPKRSRPDGPLCSIMLGERWHAVLTDISRYRRIQVLYWMHIAVVSTSFGGFAKTRVLPWGA